MQYVTWVGFGVVWMMLAYEPVERFTWVLENVLLVAFAGAFLASYRWLAWSGLAAGATLGFLALHMVGAHYTYSLVPYDSMFEALFGIDLDARMGWQRNQYDRLVHLCYGLLLAIPMAELLSRLGMRKLVGTTVIMIVMSTSLIYELTEWGAMLLFGADEGMAFLGSQGDPWDAHKDMLLASVGAIASMLIRGSSSSKATYLSRLLIPRRIVYKGLCKKLLPPSGR